MPFLLAGLFLAGCGGRTIGAPHDNDGGLRDGAVPPDSNVRTDGGRDGECTNWTMTHVRLDSLYTPQPTEITEGQVMRVAAGIMFGGCDTFAVVQMRVDRPTRRIVVTGYVWKADGFSSCPGGVPYAEEMLVLPADLEPGDWLVRESPPGNVEPLSFTFRVTSCAGDCQCNDPEPPRDYGDPCEYGCHCRPGLTCVTYLGLSGDPYRECLPSCSVDAECEPGYLCISYDDGPQGVCEPQFTGPFPVECQTDSDCGEHKVCQPDPQGGRICTAHYDMSMHQQRCECDADCLGLACTWEEGEDYGWYVCKLPCRGDRDCPSDMRCPKYQLGEPVCDWYLPD